MITATIFLTISQIFYKMGANRLSLASWYTNWYIPVGIILCGVSGVLLILALKKGEVTVLYPIFATAFIWVLVLSKYIFAEPFTSQKWIGVAIVIFGIILIGIGSNRKSAIQYGEVI